MKALSLYIHIPFCIKKCSYCDFLSFEKSGTDGYMSALFLDILKNSKDYKKHIVQTVFIGGGTPSILESSKIGALIECVSKNFSVAKNAEITMEANPETLDFEKLTTIKNSGINRLSVGVQSFSDDHLKRIGRVHSAERAKAAIEQAHKSGFENINLDLMFGLPNQNIKSWAQSIGEALKLKPTHISCYSLMLEENSVMAKENPVLPSEETDREMYHYAVAELEKHGYMQYEISNFAKKGFECRHNIVYWTGGDYLGLGLGAHSYIGSGSKDSGKNSRRFHRTESFEDYLNGDFSEYDREDLDKNAKMSEFMFLGLRLNEGISFEKFSENFGCGLFEVYGKEISELTEQGLVENGTERIRLTALGMDLSNMVFVKFLR